VDERINQHMANREQAQAASKLDKVSNTTTAILSLLRRYQALAQANAAASRLQATLGMEPDIGSVQDISLIDLKTAIGSAIKNWDNAELPASEHAKPAPEAAPKAQAPLATPAAPAASLDLPQPTKVASW
jgi:hypothetical protein